MQGVISNYTTSSFYGQFFALLSLDGRLRIWDTSSGKVIQEFSSSSVAQSACTCLCWTRSIFNKKGRKKFKRKLKSIGDEINIPFLPTLSLGTEKGSMLSYNPTTGEAQFVEKEGHSSKVNCIVYCNKSDILYSCSDDKHIIEWSNGNQELNSKWKGDDQAVTQLCMSPSGKGILSAGCSIKFWDRETKNLLQVFHGHASPISFLMFSPLIKDAEDDNGCHFLSGSACERILNAWVINTKSPQKMSVSSFMISDNPSFVTLSPGDAGKNSLGMSVGCEDGRIHFFMFSLNGKNSKPIECSKFVDCVIKGSVSKPVPFINGCFQNVDTQLTLVSGQEIKPEFSTLQYSSLSKSSVIEKELSKNLFTALNAENAKPIDYVDTTKVSNVITDALSLPIPFAIKSDKESNDDKKIEENVMDGNLTTQPEKKEELSLGERMKMQETNAKDFAAKMKPIKDAPNAGSFAQLLIQALHSKDQNMLTEILYKTSVKSNVLLNTIRRIPNNLVEPLLKTLSHELLWNPTRASTLISWLKTVTTVHLTYIITNDDCQHALNGLYRYVKSLEENHLPLLNLQGKIDLLYSFVTDEECQDDFTTAAVVYNDDSDEDENDDVTTGEKEIEDTEDGKMTTTDVGTSEEDDRTGTEKTFDSLEDLEEEDPPVDQSDTDDDEE